MDIIRTLNLWTELGRDSAQHMGSLDKQLAPVTSLSSWQRAPWRRYPDSQQGKRLDFSCSSWPPSVLSSSYSTFMLGVNSTLLLQFLYFFCPKKSLTRGRRNCQGKAFALSDVLVESVWPGPVPLPKITAPVMWMSPFSHLASAAYDSPFDTLEVATWCALQYIVSCLVTFLYPSLIPSS